MRAHRSEILRIHGSAWPISLVVLLAVACSSGDVTVGRRDREGRSQRSAAVPVGIENVNNSALKVSSHRALLRFVPDETIQIDRVYFGFKVRGAECREPGDAGDGAGDGGILRGDLVAIDPKTGVPAETIDSESINACSRHTEAQNEVGAIPVMGWVNVRATLEGGRMYGLVVSNAHENPGEHFFSFHMPIADTALSGPQARNELDPKVAGAIMALDPREHVAWSEDGGTTWQYGSENGEYRSYVNDEPEHPATRIPHYGFRLADGSNVAGQPYYAYRSDCVDCTVVYSGARFSRTFTEIGGFTASGTDVGTLTLTNLSTGVSAACTPPVGYGFRTCRLDTPLAVSPGDEYSIASTGSVELMRMDLPQRVRFPDVGTEDSVHSAYQPESHDGSNSKDVPSLWAGPESAQHPTLDEN